MSSGYEIVNEPYSKTQVAYILVEGGGINGSFTLKGHINLKGNSLFVSARGLTSMKQLGSVSFWASLELIVNKRCIFNKAFSRSRGPELWPDDGTIPIGTISVELPPPHEGEATELIIQGGYIYRAAEGSAVPMPSSTKISIPLATIRHESFAQ